MGALRALAFAAGVALAAGGHANELPLSQGIASLPDEPRDEISSEDRARIWLDIDTAQKRLALPKAGERPAFRWPLRAARGYSDPFVDVVSNFVDHDSAYPGQLRDYQCGRRTYDRDTGYNHKGIDISLWPDGWNMMAAQHAEIVAAAAGVIVGKDDGNFDRNCRFNTASWNAVYVQHDDGSIAWYGHMKSGSTTAKAVGQRVVAGEYLGTVGSSGNSTGPHLHLEVYDAARQLVDPFAGACNTLNADSWWASQPPYRVTRVNRALTASAIPVFSTCGEDGRLQDAGTFNAKTSFRPGEVVYFITTVRDVLQGQGVSITIRRPDGTVWRQLALPASSQDFNAAYWYASYALEPSAPAGTWLFEAELAGTRAQSAFDVTPTGAPRANYTDLWWNPAESGWGLNLVHQGDLLFATWFTYDTDRAGLWLVISEARLQADGSYAGAIHLTTGTPLAQIDARPAANASSPVGSGTLRFTSANQGTFSYTVNGVTQQKAISRFQFGAPPACGFTTATRAFATNYQDLWWNAAESGWGINLAHQGDVLFATWFTYGAGGRGQWLVGSELRRQPTGEFSGRLHRTTGTPFSQVSGAPAASGYTDVGSITLAFGDGRNARMDYSVDGVAQSKAITRFLFANPQTLCR